MCVCWCAQTETKALKRLVRDCIDPERGLGHVDGVKATATSKGEEKAGAEGKGAGGGGGRDGKDGKDGVDGVDGQDGRDGRDGRNGMVVMGRCANCG